MTFKLVARCASCHQEIDYTARFWSQVDKSEHPTGCWIWKGLRSNTGYGKVTVGGRTYSAHRIAYQFTHGPVKTGRRHHDTCVCHTCDNRECVNPDHLYIGTMAENIFDRDSRGRARDQCGEKHNMAKLTDEQVMEIRARAAKGEMQKDLAAEFGVTRGMLCMIVNRKNWTHI